MSWLPKFTKLMQSAQRREATAGEWFVDETKCLNPSEVIALRRASTREKQSGLQRRHFTSIRNWFMIELGLNAGLRVEEMASLRHGDLFLNNGRSSLRVLGKGKKLRPVWISSRFKKLCGQYIIVKTRLGFAVDNDAFLLNNRRGEKISKRALQKFFSTMVAESIEPGAYSIHSLRHTYATFLLKATHNNYRFAQKQLGHASIRTTQVYAGVLESDARAGLEKMYR